MAKTSWSARSPSPHSRTESLQIYTCRWFNYRQAGRQHHITVDKKWNSIFPFLIQSTTHNNNSECNCNQKHRSHLTDIFNSKLHSGEKKTTEREREIPAKSRDNAANLFRTDSYRHIMHSTKLVENKFMFQNHRIIFRLERINDRTRERCSETSATSARKKSHRGKKNERARKRSEDTKLL